MDDILNRMIYYLIILKFYLNCNSIASRFHQDIRLMKTFILIKYSKIKCLNNNIL